MTVRRDLLDSFLSTPRGKAVLAEAEADGAHAAEATRLDLARRLAANAEMAESEARAHAAALAVLDGKLRRIDEGRRALVADFEKTHAGRDGRVRDLDRERDEIERALAPVAPASVREFIAEAQERIAELRAAADFEMGETIERKPKLLRSNEEAVEAAVGKARALIESAVPLASAPLTDAEIATRLDVLRRRLPSVESVALPGRPPRAAVARETAAVR